MIRFLGRLFKWAITAYIVMSLAMLAWTFLWPDPNPDALDPADAIVCLGGGMSADGTLADAVLTRIERCVQLYEAGLAPVVIFSGGPRVPNGPTAGAQMAHYATLLGLPEENAVTETRAQSTLQNAVFTLELAAGARSFIIVTEAFHLPRSWASFKWASWETGLFPRDLQLVMSEPVRTDPINDDINWRILARESLAIWFNLARAVAYSAAPDPKIDWLH